MTSIPRRAALPLLGLLLAPALAGAATQHFQCGLSHFVRSGGTEMVSGTLSVRNVDAAHAATIRRLTIRDGDGNVVHDSGPDTATPLPLNTDFPAGYPAGKDITVVPPGGAVYLRSNHIWGNASLPAGNEVGQLLSATVVVAKDGLKSAVTVNATQRMRTRSTSPTGSPIESDTRATNTNACGTVP